MSHAAERSLPLDASPLDRLDVDCLVIPVFEGDDFTDLPGLDAATGGEVTGALTRRELTGKSFEIFITPVANGWKSRRLVLVGAGARHGYSADLARRLASTGVLAARQRRVDRLAILLRDA